MAGMDRNTGVLISGWDDILQSVRMILTTAIGSRIMRRDFGSDLPALLDRPMNGQAMIDVYVAVVEALEPREINGRQYGEPRFAITSMIPSAISESGLMQLQLSGAEFPRGHLGDFSIVNYRSFSL